MSNLGKAIAPDTFQIERTLRAPAERVWSFIVDADKRSRWFCAGDTIREDGQSFEFQFGHHRITDEKPPERWARMDGSQPDVVMKGTVLAIAPPRSLTITWGGGDTVVSEVTFELTPQDDATLLTITHRKIATRASMLNFAGGWTAHVGALEHVLAGERPDAFWKTMERCQTDYDRVLPS